MSKSKIGLLNWVITGKNGEHGENGENRDQGQGQICGIPKQNKGEKARTRNRKRNLKNNIRVLQTKVEQGEVRLGSGNQVWRIKSEFQYRVTWSVTQLRISISPYPIPLYSEIRTLWSQGGATHKLKPSPICHWTPVLNATPCSSCYSQQFINST